MTPQVTHGLLILAAIALCVCVKVNAQVIVSVQDGDWSSTSTWSGGVVPTFNNSSSVVIDHDVSLPSGYLLSIDDVTVNGILTVADGAELTILDGSSFGDISVSEAGMLNVYGKVVCSNGATLTGTTPSNTTFFNGSTYHHLSTAEGVIPLAVWERESTFEITGLTGNLTMQSPNWGQTFGNLVYDCPNQGFSISFKGLLTHIGGDFIVTNTNLGTLRLSQSEDMNLQVDGSVMIEGPSEIWFSTSGDCNINVGGNFAYNSTSGASSYFSTTGETTFTVNGDFYMNSNWRMKLASSTDAGHTDLVVKGDFQIEHGILDALNNESNTAGGTGTIIFDGSSNQTVYIARTTATGFLGNISFVVEENSELNLGESLLSNSTSGSLLVKGRLSLASTNSTGVMQAGSNGNIDVMGTIQFQPGSILELNGIAEQFIGFPNLNGASLVINNSFGVSLLNDLQSDALTLEQGDLNVGSFSFAATGDVELENGIINGPGGVIMNGAIDQTLSAFGSTIENLSISKSAPSGVSLTTPLSVSGLIIIQSEGSTMHSNGNLTLLSTSESVTGTASIGPLPSGSAIVGDVHVQRFMAGVGDKYRYISSPITNATVQSLKDALPITGTFDDPSSGPGVNSTAPSLFEYDETINHWKPYPTSGLAADNFFEAGKGYCYFNWNYTQPTLWTATGEVNQGDLSYTLTYTNEGDVELDGWNLIGNPYPCAIRWDEGSGWQRNANVSLGIAVRDNVLGGFRYWDGQVGNLPDGRIASGQSFWVRATADNAQLTIRESAKATGGASFYRTRDVLDFIELEIRQRDISDKTFLRMRESAEETLDKYDVPKFANDNLSLSFLTSDSVSVAINAVPEVSCHMEIPIKVQTKMRASEQASVSLRSFGSFEGSRYRLFHEGTGESFELNSSGSITLPPHITFDGLKLIVDSAVPQETSILAPSFVCANDSFKIQPENFQNGIVYELYADNDLSIIEPGSSLWSGNMKEGDNFFTLIGRSACSSRVLADSILVEKVTPPAPAVTNSLVCQGEKATLSVKDIQGINFHWYTLSIDTAIHVGTRYETGPLVKSKTYFVSAIDSLGCESSRTEVVAEVISYDSVSIEFAGGILTSSYAEGNQWFFNGKILEGEVGQTLIAIDPGLYGVVVTVGSCQLSAEYTYTVTNVEEQGMDVIVDVYPNPSIDRLYIRFRPEFNVELIDILSSSAVSVRYLCDISSDRGMFGIDTTFLTSGLYIIFLNIQKDPFFVKFIKH